MVRNAREQTLGVRGAQLFNLLTENLRSMNTEHVDTFKNHLDVFLFLVMVDLLKGIVQPKMDYCSQLWSPTDQSTVNKLESVQHHLIARIRDSRLTGLNYWEKLQELRLYSQ